MGDECVYCAGDGGLVVYADALCRVVVADEAYAGFCRVILQRHLTEMTDLSPAERAALMRAVFAVEAALREILRPHKMNLASLGNAVPHVHWHVIPRFADDARFPQPVWGEPLREAAPRALPEGFVAALTERLVRELPGEAA